MDQKNRLTICDNTQCEQEDRYSASIDFSNACREFYISRVKATESFKEQMKLPDNNTAPSRHGLVREKKRNSIDTAMETLRTEMASLMEQDLSLMKQLLTLNETIEEIKFKRLHGNKNHLQVGSREFDGSGSDWSVSDTDMYEVDDVFEELSKDALNVNLDCSHSLSSRQFHFTSYSQRHGDISDISLPNIQINGREYDYGHSSKPEVNSGGKQLRIAHGCQHSIDSGYDESDSYQTDIEVTL